MQKLSRSMMRSWMLRQLKVNQGGLCAVCKKPIDTTVKGEGVTDHNHITGEIRGVLHRSCNSALGKVDHAVRCWGSKGGTYEDIINWLKNMLEYYAQPGCGVIYPYHLTPEEKKQADLLRRRSNRASARAKQILRNETT